ncbi:MAG: ATP-grasp domain-containing protein [Ktedonobacteraceae bacterium]|nr:ATP-grasp domain-containing protein [Ktedonobacteraceae bacterium]
MSKAVDRVNTTPGAALPPAALQYDVLVLDARLRQSLVTVRSLGRRGLRVAALESSDHAPGFSSRWCRYKAVCPAEEGTPEYLEYLEQVLTRTGARVLITSSDGTIDLLRRHRAQLASRVHIALAEEPALGIAINKERTLAIAERLGIAIPRGVTVRAAGEVEAALREIGLPAVVKPIESWVRGEERSIRFAPQLVTTPDEARRAIEEQTGLGSAILFQQFLSGRREGLHLFYARGAMYACFAQWTCRSDPPLGGTSVLRQSIPIPYDTGEQAERLVREIDLQGYCEVEFRRDGSGRPYLMEINPRLSDSIELAVRAGVDFPYLIYQWAGGEPIERVQGYRTGEWMRFLAGDFSTTVASILQRGRPGVPPPTRAILDFCTSFFVPMRYDYLDWHDPLPALTATAGFARLLARRVGSSLFSNAKSQNKER